MIRETKCALPLWTLPSTYSNIIKNKLIKILDQNEIVIELNRIEDSAVSGFSSFVITRFGIGWIVSGELK
mgnify:CR=1 FL=1